MAARSAAAEALDGTADLDAYQAALQQAADQMVQAQVELARAGVDARGVLEPSQEARLDELIAAGFTGCGVMRGSGVGGHG
jgi:hypothetical protein